MCVIQYHHKSSLAGEANIISVKGSCFDTTKRLLQHLIAITPQHTLSHLDTNWLEADKNQDGSGDEGQSQ